MTKSYRKSLVGVCVAVLALFGAVQAQADLLYAVYTDTRSGSLVHGVTVRDADSFIQQNYFEPGFTINGIAAGTNDDLYLTSGNSIYRYTNAGALQNSFSWGDNTIIYTSVTVGDGEIFAAYIGSQVGITVRDASTLAQSTAFLTGVNNGLGSANEDVMYRVGGNNITRLDNSGTVLNSFNFPDSNIVYTNIDVGDGVIFASYIGSQNGVTVRDAVSLVQSSVFDPLFVINGLAAGVNSDVYLTNTDRIFRYGANGSLISSMTFGSTSVTYRDIAYASVPEPGTLALLGAGLMGLALTRRRRQAIQQVSLAAR